MKHYMSPAATLVLLTSDLLMVSDENELAIDKLLDIFD